MRKTLKVNTESQLFPPMFNIQDSTLNALDKWPKGSLPSILSLKFKQTVFLCNQEESYKAAEH